MIKEFHAKNIFNKINCDLIFNSDINILTGMNGSGKTTILKIIWYILSGNIENIFLEKIFFQNLILITNKYKISLESRNIEKNTFRIDLFDIKGKCLLSEDNIRIVIHPIVFEKLNKFNEILVGKLENSVFFPTFRRIEGGFSITRYPSEEGERESRYLPYELERESRRLQESMSNISNHLSVSNHRFVYSISTQDIIELVSKKFTEVANKSSQNYAKFASETINELKNHKETDLEKDSLENANKILQKVKERARKVKKLHKDLLKPFTILEKIIKGLYKNKGIKISDQIQWGYKKYYLDSNLLSSGEKQMLSFLCYNAFFRNSPIFIDEPEISLHPDWQRLLFSILKSQESNNQFIVATHSPLIYAKYSDKELVI
jgi:predicted ATPase